MKKTVALVLPLLSMALSLSFFSCQKEEGEVDKPVQKGVQLAAREAMLYVGDTLRLAIKEGSGSYTYDNDAPMSVAVAFEDSFLVLVAKEEGRATIRVRDQVTKTADAVKVAVYPVPTPVTPGVLIEDNVVKAWDGNAIPADGRVVLPEGVVGIGAEAFSGLPIERVWLPSTLRFIGEAAFAYCNKLTEVAVPDGVDSIAGDAFYQCHGLKKATLPAGLRVMGSNAFAFCDQLSSLQLNEGMQVLGERAFYACLSLEKVSFPKSLHVLGNYAFSHCTLLRDVQLNEGLERLSEGLFEQCISLSVVSLPEGLKEVGNRAFLGCMSLVKINFPDGLKQLGAGAFSDCKSLQKVHLPQGIEEIQTSTFENCIHLSDLQLPTALRRIGIKAFKDCRLLTELTLPEGVTHIDNYAFQRILALQKVTLPKKLVQVGNNAFMDCKNLEEVVVKATTPPTLRYKVFLRTPSDKSLLVPKGTKGAYENQPDWAAAGFATVVEV